METIQYLPSEIILKIVSEFFPKKKYIIKFYCLGCGSYGIRSLFCNSGRERVFYVNATTKREIAINVTTAKNFRLVCTDIARAYCPGFIVTHVGGTLLRRQYLSLLILNGKLSTPYLKPLYAEDLVYKYCLRGTFYKKTFDYCSRHYDRKMFTIEDLMILSHDALKILDNDFMSELTKDNPVYIQNSARFSYITGKSYLDFSEKSN